RHHQPQTSLRRAPPTPQQESPRLPAVEEAPWPQSSTPPPGQRSNRRILPAFGKPPPRMFLQVVLTAGLRNKRRRTNEHHCYHHDHGDKRPPVGWDVALISKRARRTCGRRRRRPQWQRRRRPTRGLPRACGGSRCER
ncbi:unnamed protein product, partial [Ectocarpus fasciculatus]